MNNTLERTEFLGTGDGRRYKIRQEDERILAMKDGSGEWQKITYQEMPLEMQDMFDHILDDFEDGHNRLAESEGVWYEYFLFWDGSIAAARKAYDISG